MSAVMHKVRNSHLRNQERQNEALILIRAFGETKRVCTYGTCCVHRPEVAEFDAFAHIH